MLAGVLVALIGLVAPEVLGIGYDTVNATMFGAYSVLTLLGLLIAKLLATSICIGLGVPGGMIGPAFFMGAMIGASVSFVAVYFFGADASDMGFYALLGMGAMVGASLQAPLAALTAIMELTYNPGIIMPGMLTIPTTVMEFRMGIIPVRTASRICGRQASQEVAPKASQHSTSARFWSRSVMSRSRQRERPVRAFPRIMPTSGMR